MTRSTRLADAADPGTPADRLSELTRDPSPAVRREAAVNPSTPGEVIGTLAEDRDWRTRAIVAARGDVPAAAQIALIGDRSWQVRYALASNRDADQTVWRALTLTADRGTRQVFAQNDWLPEDIAYALAGDEARDVRQSLVSQTRHRSVLARLLDDQHPDVRSAGLQNRLVTVDQVVRASSDRQAVVRAAAATHELLPTADRQRLTTDRSELVRESAALDPRSVRLGRVGNEDDEMDLTDPAVLAHWPATPTKPNTSWFRIFDNYHPTGDEIPPHVARFWRLAVAVDRDPGWRDWWQPASIPRLDLWVGAGAASPQLERRGDSLRANASSAELWRLVRQDPPLDASGSDFDDVMDRLLREQLVRLLEMVADHCGLTRPPPLPAERLRRRH